MIPMAEKKDEGKKGLETSLSDSLLKEICRIVAEFRTGRPALYGNRIISIENLVLKISDLLMEEGNEVLPFTKGCVELGIPLLKEDTFSAFFCLVESFINSSVDL